ncbi:MAG: DUF4114 domain-containing protein [Candidatus Hydrogenedentes bacterium]|nr:DUF4114 domain-containing protein [Candidatus Hydrogenedentota bacterium]
MKVWKVLSLAAAIVFAMTPAMATVINDGANPVAEQDLWQIYNSLGYGPVGADSNLIPQVSPDEVWTLLTSGQFIATVHFAGNTETLGFYQPVGAPSSLTPIFTVLPSDGPVSTLVPAIAGPFGFYLTSTGYNGTQTWYSESALNPGSQDHMIALATGNPDTVLLAWEDLPLFGSGPDPNYDSDYNDLVVTFTRVIPEPTSMVLLGMGIAGVVVRRMRRK